MAGMAGYQNLVVGFSLDPIFTEAQAAGLERGVDAYFVFIVLHFLELAMAQTESPVFPVIGGSIRNQVRGFGQGEEVGSELCEWHLASYRDAVVKDLEVAPPKINHAFAPRILYVSVTNVPLFWNCPVEYLRPSRNLSHLQRDGVPHDLQAPPYPITGNAATDRVEGFDESICLATLTQRIDPLKHVAQNFSRWIGAAGRFGRHSFRKRKRFAEAM
jgi:hypothetical protein